MRRRTAIREQAPEVLEHPESPNQTEHVGGARMAAEQHTPETFAFTDHAGEHWLVMADDGPCFGPLGVSILDRFEVVGHHNARDFVAWQRSRGCHLRAVNVSQGPPCERIRRSELEAHMAAEEAERCDDVHAPHPGELDVLDEGEGNPRMGLVEHMKELLDLGQLDTRGRLWGAIQSARLRADLGGGA